MDTSDLYIACRTGDLSKVRYLVETKEVEVNIRDAWDSTPLYYACLCGHGELVEYLVSIGARCDANTFDGERCLYGALTDDIRRLLLRNQMITRQTIRRDAYQEFLRRLSESGQYSDVEFSVHGVLFRLHRCVLAARSQYFCDLLEDKWRHRTHVTLNNHMIDRAAFASIVQYLYTGRMEVAVNLVDDCLRLASQCKLAALIYQLRTVEAKVDEFVRGKPGTRVTRLVVEPDDGVSELALDLGVMAGQAVPLALCRWAAGTELPLMPAVPPRYVDICFSIQQHRFPAHKVFVCGRSEYFSALVRDHFNEGQMESDVPVISIQNLSPSVFVHILYYLYQDYTTLHEDSVLDVLYAADLCLLPGLKRQCAVCLAGALNTDCVVHMLRLSRLMMLPRLEDACTQFMAQHIEQMCGDVEFNRLVVEDADSVRARQQTDSICVIDDIRCHISSSLQTFSDMADAQCRLQRIDALLQQLQLNA